MLFKTKKAKWIFYISIVLIILIFVLIRDSGYVPQAYSLHLISREDRGQRLVIFEEEGEFVKPLWERASFFADRGVQRENDISLEDYYFEIYFSEGQNLLAQKGRFVVYPNRLIVDGEEMLIDAGDFFAFCQQVIQSRRALFSLLGNAESVGLKDPDEEKEKELSRDEVDELLKALEGLSDGEKGNAPIEEETKYKVIIPEGEIFLQSDNSLIFSFWGGYWHYSGAEKLEDFFDEIKI